MGSPEISHCDMSYVFVYSSYTKGLGMATITVRVDDDTRDALQEKAQDQGVSLSDMVRGLLREAVVPVRSADHLDSFSPDTLPASERQVLALLHRILARVLPADANEVDGDLAYQLKRARVLEEGYTKEYDTEFIGIQKELSPRDCARVMDILDMFRIIDYSIDHLAKEGTPLDAAMAEDLRYQGFDLNDALEGQMAEYVRFLVEGGRWTERLQFIQATNGGNSHMSTLDLYLRMLAEYRRIKDGRRRLDLTDYLLGADELQRLALSMTHPSHRPGR